MSGLNELLRHPANAPLLVEGFTTLTYSEALQAVQATRETLAHQGVSEGAVVALHTMRDFASITTFLALLEMECSIVLIHARWPQSMVADAVQRSAASYVIRACTLNDIEVSSTPRLKPSWATEAAVIVATSGSSGEPKLALLSLAALLASARTSAPACALTVQDRWLLSLPLFHVGGLGILFRTLVTGSSLAISNENLGDAATTHISLVPTQLYRLLKDPASRERLPRLKTIMLGGAPIGERIISECVALGAPIMTTYGLTEMGSAVTLASSAFLIAEHAVSLGHTLPGREMKIAADGEVLTRGTSLFRGYLTSDGLSLPLVEGDWFPTGDIGALLPDGTLVIIGRRDAQFISGGENIHPEMVENALTNIPGIMAACVVPIPDEEFGHRPYAFVVSEGTELNIEELRESLRPLIPGFALPVGIQEAPPDLLTPTGKVKRAMAIHAAGTSTRR